MRRITSFGLMAILLMFMAPTLEAQDVTGDWTITYSMMGRQGGQAREVTQEFTLTLAEDGTTVTGTTMMAMRGGRRGAGGGAAPAPREVAISDGKYEGGTLTFTISQTMGERTMTTTYTATVTGSTMEGSLARSGGMGGGEPTPFKGVKKEG